jgi:hypothetical protein
VTRIIKTTTPGKERARLSKAIVITIREFMRLKEPTAAANDMVAFVIIALQEIAAGIEKSVAAWEKRGYWVKADKYRMEWRWSGQLAGRLAEAFEGEEWPNVAGMLVEVMGHFENIKVSDRHRMGKPWVNALKEYRSLQQE